MNRAIAVSYYLAAFVFLLLSIPQQEPRWLLYVGVVHLIAGEWWVRQRDT